MWVAKSICLRLLRHLVRLAFSLALLKAGRSILASMEMMAMTTNNSISVKALLALSVRIKPDKGPRVDFFTSEFMEVFLL